MRQNKGNTKLPNTEALVRRESSIIPRITDGWTLLEEEKQKSSPTNRQHLKSTTENRETVSNENQAEYVCPL